MAKHSMVQTLEEKTHVSEVPNLIWTNNHELISDIMVTLYHKFTDNSVTSATSYKVKDKTSKEQIFLLESGRQMKALDFTRSPWIAIRTRLLCCYPNSSLSPSSPFCSSCLGTSCWFCSCSFTINLINSITSFPPFHLSCKRLSPENHVSPYRCIVSVLF